MSRGERGAATVLVMAMATLLMLMACALSAVGGLVIAHRRAQSAADLAALAGARALANGQDACAEAGRVAASNRATMRRCSLVGSDVLVEVHVSGPGWLGPRPQLRGQARAGPG